MFAWSAFGAHIGAMSDPLRPTTVHHHALGLLDFTDSSGVMWTVSEITRLDFSERLIALLPHPERRGGWLLFESEQGDRRRLTPVPPAWRDLSPSALEEFLAKAVPPNSNEHRRRSDQPR
jgi:hypothetical protein